MTFAGRQRGRKARSLAVSGKSPSPKSHSHWAAGKFNFDCNSNFVSVYLQIEPQGEACGDQAHGRSEEAVTVSLAKWIVGGRGGRDSSAYAFW